LTAPTGYFYNELSTPEWPVARGGNRRRFAGRKEDRSEALYIANAEVAGGWHVSESDQVRNQQEY